MAYWEIEIYGWARTDFTTSFLLLFDGVCSLVFGRFNIEFGFSFAKKKVTYRGEALSVVLKVISTTPALWPKKSKRHCPAAQKELNMVTQTRVHLQTLVLLFFVGKYNCARCLKRLVCCGCCTSNSIGGSTVHSKPCIFSKIRRSI